MATPSISYTPAPDSEGQQYDGVYTIDGKAVHPIYGTVAGTGGDDPNAGARSGISGFSGGIEHINGQDYTAQYDASGNLLGYRPYAGESFFSSTVKPLLPVIASAIAPGLGEFIGGATGLTGANLAAATGATMGGGIAGLTGQNVVKGALLGGAAGYAGSSLGSTTPSSGPIDTNGWDMQSAANYDAGLQGVGNNLTGLSDLQLAQMYDAGLTGVGSNLSNLSDLQLAQMYDQGLTGVGSNVGTDFSLAGAYDQGLNGVGDNLTNSGTSTTTSIGKSDLDLAKAYDEGLTNVGNNAGTAVTGVGAGGISLGTLAKLATLGLGGAGVKSLVDNQSSNTITGGGTAGPLAGYNFDPSRFQATTPDPAMFRPGAGIVTVADALRAQQAQPTINMAKGGSTKPTYSTKAQLASMNPWERSAAELNNAAFVARMPSGAGTPQVNVAQLGQFAHGGIADLGSYSDGGRMLKGGGDGMSDSIPATIGGKRPARLADGEFVVPADVVSGLGNGSTDAGARTLYKMMDRVRMARTGTKKQGKEINALKHMPA